MTIKYWTIETIKKEYGNYRIMEDKGNYIQCTNAIDSHPRPQWTIFRKLQPERLSEKPAQSGCDSLNSMET